MEQLRGRTKEELVEMAISLQKDQPTGRPEVVEESEEVEIEASCAKIIIGLSSIVFVTEDNGLSNKKDKTETTNARKTNNNAVSFLLKNLFLLYKK